MRSTLALTLWVAGSFASVPAAYAQTCEGSASGKAGEVIVSRSGSEEAATWIVERVEGEGSESSHFARPALMLDFEFTRGNLAGPSATVVSITRFSDPDIGRAPELDRVRVRARMSERSVEWLASDASKGERDLAQALRAEWPDRLAITLHATGSPGGAELAAAVFDLSAKPAAEALARQALANRVCD